MFFFSKRETWVVSKQSCKSAGETANKNHDSSSPYVAKIFRRGVTWMTKVYVCMHDHVEWRGLGGCSPRKFLEIACSEIVPEAITIIWDRSEGVVQLRSSQS